MRSEHSCPYKTTQDKGYGFLKCDQTYNVYGCDIYINRLAIGLFQKGDEVIFSVELNKEGKPQGKSLMPLTVEAKSRQLRVQHLDAK